MSKKNKTCIESIIGKCIYFGLLFYPIIATLINCLVGIFNTSTTPDLTQNIFINEFENVMSTSGFEWVENSAIYTGITNTTNALGIDYIYLNMILTYWLILTIIYIIYDIALIMVQIAHKKIHELIEG